MFPNHFIAGEYNAQPTASGYKQVKTNETSQHTASQGEYSNFLGNSGDASYMSRVDDSRLMKTINPNRSFDITHIEVEDLEEPVKLDNSSPKNSPALKSRTVSHKHVPVRPIVLESGKFEHKELINMTLVIAESPEYKGATPNKNVIGADSQHLDPLAARERLRRYKPSSQMLSGSELQFGNHNKKTWEGNPYKEEMSISRDIQREFERADSLSSHPGNNKTNTTTGGPVASGGIIQTHRSLKEKSPMSKQSEEVKEEQEEDEKVADQEQKDMEDKKESEPKGDVAIQLDPPPGPRPKTGSSSKGEKTCKICLETTEDDKTGRFVAPCKCTGSVQNIHDNCLKTWIRARGIDPKKAKCELCHTKYKMKFTFKMIFTPKNAIHEGVVSLVSGICLLGMIIGLMVLAVTLITSNDLDQEPQPAPDPNSTTKQDPDDASRSGTPVKVFVALVCGIFVTVLSLLLCFSWKEAFFVSKITSWKIEDYQGPKNQPDPANKSQKDSQSQSSSYYSQSSEPREEALHSLPNMSGANQLPLSLNRIQDTEGVLEEENQAEPDVMRDEEVERQENRYVRRDIRIKRQDSHTIEEDFVTVLKNYGKNIPRNRTEENSSKEVPALELKKIEEMDKYLKSPELGPEGRDNIIKSVELELESGLWKEKDSEQQVVRSGELRMSDRLRKIVNGQSVKKEHLVIPSVNVRIPSSNYRTPKSNEETKENIKLENNWESLVESLDKQEGESRALRKDQINSSRPSLGVKVDVEVRKDVRNHLKTEEA